ncbi:MAG TPA: YciI family protein [Ohtaekwangia sp.]|uniref:YciI family protein n=1 Tax=Ohtaekwangia sp. TaxID=2066019 RepID=UPI002F939415
MFFLYKLIPPRPTFAQDMTEQERAIMQQHIEYWNNLVKDKIGVVFGPVFDPQGVWGLGIMEVDTPEAAERVSKEDPAIKTGLNTFELIPMRLGLIRS